jgi:hypothetical protein
MTRAATLSELRLRPRRQPLRRPDHLHELGPLAIRVLAARALRLFQHRIPVEAVAQPGIAAQLLAEGRPG